MAEPGDKLSCKESLKLCCRYHWRGKLSIIIPLITLPILIYGYVNSKAEFKCLFLVVTMALLWITEAIPLYITSLLPVVFLPITGILSCPRTCGQYLTDTLTLFLAGLIIALAIEYSKLNIRIALATILCIGCGPRRLQFGLIVCTAILSMWISNSATAAMMCPIVKAVINEMHANNVFDAYMSQEEEPVEPGDEPHPSTISMAFYFSVCYAATIGSCGTLIGTGTNLVFKGLYDTRFPHSVEKVNFVTFMAYAMPITALVNLVLLYLMLQITHMGLCRPNSNVGKQVARGEAQKSIIKKMVQESYRDLGPINCHEIQVLLAFILMIVLLVTRNPGFMPGWGQILNAKKIGSSACMLICMTLLFALPTQYTFFKYCCGKAPFTGQTMDACLSWAYVNKNLPWGLCLLLGGGFAIAEGSKASGMAKMIGNAMSGLKVLPHFWLIGFILIFTSFMTLFCSNVATCNILIPIYSEMALAVRIHPLLLTFPAALSVNCAFLLPVSTPPNAIVCGFGNIKTKYLAKAGLFPTFWSFVLLWINAMTWGKVVYPATATFPSWAEDDPQMPHMLDIDHDFNL